MKISNGISSMRVTLTDAEKAELMGNSNSTMMYIMFNGLDNPEGFLDISRDDGRGRVPINIVSAGPNNARTGYPWVMTLPHAKFKKINKLPRFAPEELPLIPIGIAGEWTTTRPPMDRPPHERGASTHKITSRRITKDVSPPSFTKPSQPIEMPGSGLRAAVETINKIKDDLGESLDLEIDAATGRLRAMVVYG